MLEKSRKKTSCIVAILIAPLLIAVLLPILSFAEPGRVNTEKGKLNLRKKPEDGARLVTTIPNGSSIDVLSYDNENRVETVQYSNEYVFSRSGIDLESIIELFLEEQ